VLPRFQADADFNEDILFAVVRRELSIDFQTAEAAGLAGLPDLKVLERAAAEGRILVTHDQKTMPDHFARFVADQNSSGVLIVPQHLPLAVVVEELLLVWDATEAEEWTNRIAYLPL
jgi:hypothetical protein